MIPCYVVPRAPVRAEPPNTSFATQSERRMPELLVICATSPCEPDTTRVYPSLYSNLQSSSAYIMMRSGDISRLRTGFTLATPCRCKSVFFFLPRLSLALNFQESFDHQYILSFMADFYRRTLLMCCLLPTSSPGTDAVSFVNAIPLRNATFSKWQIFTCRSPSIRHVRLIELPDWANLSRKLGSSITLECNSRYIDKAPTRSIDWQPQSDAYGWKSWGSLWLSRSPILFHTTNI